MTVGHREMPYIRSVCEEKMAAAAAALRRECASGRTLFMDDMRR